MAEPLRLRLGGELPISPEDALLKALALANMDVHVWGELAAVLQEPAARQAVLRGDVVHGPHAGTAGQAMWGDLYHLTGERTGEAVVHVVIREHQEAQKRLREAAAACTRAKVQEKRAEAAMLQAQTLAAFGKHLVALLGHNHTDPKVRGAMREALGTVAATPLLEGHAIHHDDA